MTRSWSAIALVVCLALTFAPSARAELGIPFDRAGALRRTVARPPLPQRVLVVDDAGRIQVGPNGALASTSPRLANLLAAHGLAHGRSLWTGGTARGTRFLSLTSSRPDFDPAAVAEEFRRSGLVRAALPDLRLSLHVIPNDPELPQQWYVNDGGFADIHLPAAWDVEKGSAAVRIGIMDTGVDLTHPDLASRIWTNPGEIPANGRDDDGDGYVDDVHGWDFGDADNDPDPHPVLDPTVYDLDVGFHGTFVAGVAAAATNNAEGIAGAGWNCSIVPLKVVNQAGDITLDAVSEAYGYAAAHHIEVLNTSFGVADGAGVPEYFQALVDEATAAGVLCVASAGNDGTADLNYPAACARVLSVAATDETNARASFSNYGPTVRIGAPGATMWSALCQNYVIDDFSQLFYEVFFGWDGIVPYMGGDGTSFSAPLAAGVCGLVRSRHPDWPPLTVLAHVIATGDPVAYDQPIGPKLNAWRAVTEATLGVPPGVPASPGLHVVPDPFVSVATVRFELPARGITRLCVFDCGGRLVRELANDELPAGPHELRWDGNDAHGRPASTGVYLIGLETPAGKSVRKLVRLR